MSGGSQGPGLSGLPPPQEHDQEDEAEHGGEAGQRARCSGSTAL